MKKFLCWNLMLAAFTVLLPARIFAQNYTVLGNAVSYLGCSCYKLTDDANNEGGAVFQNRTINLNNAFDYSFQVFLGCNNGAGADGECFVLTSNPNGLGQLGGGLGYGGGSQPFSLAVEFDTYQNGWDPPYAHIAIESGGNIQHNVAAPVPALVSRAPIDDCNWHTVRVVWNPAIGSYIVYFDGVLRQSIIIPNMVATYFGGNPIVNWGWSAATGGARNEQRVCITSTSNWVTGSNYQSCSPTIQFNDISTSSVGSIQSWAWVFGDGGTSALQNPSHTYASAGTYTVVLTITDNTGCTFSSNHTITIFSPVSLSAVKTNPQCNGGTDGSIAMTATGGSGAGYSFNWNNGASFQQTYTIIGAGTYTVSVTDGAGCTATGTYTLSQPTAMIANTSHTDATCGHTDGSVTISITGGTPPYTGVGWNGTPGYTVNNLPMGTYVASFYDSHGCTAALQYREVVNQLPCGYNLSSSGTNVTCSGGSNGSATLTVTGGTAPITITWINATTGLNAGSGATISGLKAATYNYTYHDGNNQTFTGSVTVSEPVPMVANITPINTSCGGTNDGQALVSITSGGVSPFTYNWSRGLHNTPADTGLSPGALTVSVTDANGCSTTATATITGPPTLLAPVSGIDDSCYQSHKGSTTVTPTGGNPPYTYYWSNISSAQTDLSLVAGTYTVTVTDSKNCTVTNTVTISQAPRFTHTLTSTNIKCFGATTGTITVTATGGTPAYSYLWSPVTATGSTPSGLAAGQYNLTLTDNHNCTILDSVVLTQPATALTASSSHTNVTCFGANNGRIIVTVAGGVQPYSFLGHPVPAGTDTVYNLAPATYAGALMDSNGCSVNLSETITSPGPQSLTLSHVDDLCYGASTGTATANFVNATGAVVYNWSNSQTGSPISGLAANTYSITATDANGCTQTGSVIVIQPPIYSLTVDTTHVNCFGGNGTATANALGGTPGYTYAWSSGVAVTQTVTLPAGNYQVTVTDHNLCTISSPFTITQPAAALNAVTSHTDVTCFGAGNGTMTITITGGTAPYTYLGNPIPAGPDTIKNLAPAVYSGTITDANGCTFNVSETVSSPGAQSLTLNHTDDTCYHASMGTATALFVNATGAVVYDWSNSQTGSNITGLAAGTYNITATDANNCTQTGSVTVVQPAVIVMNVATTAAACFAGNGTATGNPTGTSPFTFVWSGAAGTGASVPLPFGTYTVTSTDAGACEQTATFSITQPTEISIQIAQTNINCFGDSTGSIMLTVGGGTGPAYTYTWNPNVSAGVNAISLPAGVYAITVTDQNNCPKDTSVSLTQPALPLTTNIQSRAIPCFGQNNGTITLSTTGGTPAYSYNWNPNVSSVDSATGLSPGNYAVTVTDINHCSSAYSVTITQPNQPLSLTPSQTNLSCYQSNNGVARVVASGGTLPFTYLWTPNVSTVDSATGLAAGNYMVSVTDFNSCTATSSYNITQPLALTSSATTVAVLCNGFSTGAITVAASGGTPTYTYSWNPGVSTTDSATNIPAGNYSITVTDINNCTVIQPATVTQPQPITDTAIVTAVLCGGGSTGTLAVSANGGATPYSFSISAGGAPVVSATGLFTNLAANTYTVVVTDNNSCTLSSTATITQPAVLVSSIAAVNPTCYHYANGQVVEVPMGGVQAYHYSFSNGVASANGTLTGLVAGSYAVTITDANNCTVSDSTILVQPDSVLINVTPSPAEMKMGTTLQLTSTTNQSQSITYAWTPDFGLNCYDCSDPVFNGVYSQTYTVVATTQDGCRGTSEFIVNVIPNYDLFFPNAFTPNGDGQNDFWQVFGNLGGVKQMEIAVFNRIGEKVFESNDLNFKWDGTYKGAPAPEGVYLYTGKFVWLNNYSNNTFKGSVTLLR